MAQIEDGTGAGFRAKVDKKNRLTAKAVVLPEIHDESDGGNAYSWVSGTFDYAAADTILLVKNTGEDKLDIEGVWLSGDTDTRVEIHLVTADVTVAGTTIVGVNLNTGSANTASAEAARNETGNTQGSIIWSGEIHATQNPLFVPLYGSVILAKNKSIGVDYVTNGAACDVTILGFFD